MNENSAPANSEVIVGSVYLHIGNSGVTFEVVDHCSMGPTIRVRSSTFGNNEIEQSVMVTPDAFPLLAELFEKAKNHSFMSKPYCCAAHPVNSELVQDCSSSDNGE